MFKKLLSNLPFNPSLINQLANYGVSLQKEQGWRRLGLWLMITGLALQVVAIIALPHHFARWAVAVLTLLTVVVAGCWLRVKLLIKEVAIVRREYSKGN